MQLCKPDPVSQMLTDSAAAVVWDANYRPFGEATVTGALTFNLRFPGQYADAETGLHYNYFRDYDPATGRYIESDPIGLQAGWNTYAYVSGNPVKWVDPKGLAINLPPNFPSPGHMIGCQVAKALREIFCKRGQPKGCDPRKTKYQKLDCDEIARRYDRLDTCIIIRRAITNICFGGIPDKKHDEQEEGLENAKKTCLTRYENECLRSCPAN